MNVEEVSRGARLFKALKNKVQIFKTSEGRPGQGQETRLSNGDVSASVCVIMNNPHTHTKTHKQSNSAVKETQNGSSWKCQRYTFNAN